VDIRPSVAATSNESAAEFGALFPVAPLSPVSRNTI
jgi:hypothetical protein